MGKVKFIESGLEESFLSHIQTLGYEYIPPEAIVRSSYKSPLAEEILSDSLIKINPTLSIDVIYRAIRVVSRIDVGFLERRNETFFGYLKDGVEIKHYHQGREKTSRVYLIDYENIENNSFVITNQFTVDGNDQKRPDIVLFVNGLPLVVMELKSPTSMDVDIHNAYLQMRNYQLDIEELFVYNAFNIISDFSSTKVGSITANEEWYKEWKTTDGSYESTRHADYKTLLTGILEKSRLLDIIKNFILFEDNKGKTIKIMAQYHQYFAVRKAVESTISAIRLGDGRGGVFWHTQGSGKSLSMVFYTHLMMKRLGQPTFVIITDRNDLDDQLYGQFSRVQDFLRQTPIQAESRVHLQELLENRKSHGIFFTTMQKFTEYRGALTERDDVIVIADEAHRSQYGLRETIERSGRVTVGMARLVRESLPNATYIGFTGTPISKKDKDTQEVFGNYIDIYDMSQSVEDGATKPIYYENRVINLGLNESILSQIDELYRQLTTEDNEYAIEQSKRDSSKLATLLGSEKAIDTLVRDIISHYEETRENLLTGKAMIVAYNREIALKILKRILELRPEWEKKVDVVMTSDNNDPEEWKEIIGNKDRRDELAKKFKDDNDEFKIAIVVDMWLTGFDVPSLSTMYIYKPMKGHNLMQAIARVNRVFEDKEGGLVVDYIGIASALKEAMSDYTRADQNIMGSADIRDSAYPKFQEYLEICRNYYFNKFNYSIIHSKYITDEEMSDIISDGVNFVMGFDEELLKDFRDDAYGLRQAHSLCSSITTPYEQREAAFIEAVRVSVNRIVSPGKFNVRELNRQVSEMLEQSIRSEGVINLFRDFDKGFSLFDSKFLKKVETMEQKNLSVELLNKLLSDEISSISRFDVVKGKEFSERLKAVMKRYREGLIDNAKSLDRFAGIAGESGEDEKYHENLNKTRDLLVDIAKDAMDLRKENERLGLSREELSFYHAISKPENIQDFYTDEELIELTKELTEVINNAMTTDWIYRESERANVRMKIKRLLMKYNYPKNETAKILPLVVKQAEHLDMMKDVVGR